MPSTSNSTGKTQLISIAETAGRLSISSRTVWQMIRDGVLTPIRFGRRSTRIDEAEVERFIDSARREGGHASTGASTT